MKTKRALGFTLIELMIVVAIIAILAAIAISQYKDYVIRTQVAEGASLVTGGKIAVTEYYNNRGHFGADNDAVGLPSPTSIVGKYVADVTVASGRITVVYGNEANNEIRGEELIYSAIPHAGSMAWACNPSSQMRDVWVPSACRGD